MIDPENHTSGESALLNIPAIHIDLANPFYMAEATGALFKTR